MRPNCRGRDHPGRGCVVIGGDAGRGPDPAPACLGMAKSVDPVLPPGMPEPFPKSCAIACSATRAGAGTCEQIQARLERSSDRARARVRARPRAATGRRYAARYGPLAALALLLLVLILVGLWVFSPRPASATAAPAPPSATGAADRTGVEDKPAAGAGPAVRRARPRRHRNSSQPPKAQSRILPERSTGRGDPEREAWGEQRRGG